MRIVALVCVGLLLLTLPRLSAQSVVPTWRAVRDVRAGAGEGPGALTSVSGLTVGRDGSVYVSQPQEHIVRVYDARGRFVRKIGREGAGPGEFDRPSSLGWRGDTLWVADGAQTRISLFRPNGAFVRTITFVRTDRITEGKPHIPGELLADGSVLGYWRTPLHVLTGPRPVSAPLVRFTQRGEPINVIGRLHMYHEFARIRSGTGVTYVPQPFSDSPLTDVAPDGSGLVLVTRDAATTRRGASFSVRKIHYSGRTTFARAYLYAPIPLGSEAVEKAVDEHVGGLANARFRTPPPAAARRAIREVLYRPKYLTPVTSVVLGRDGTTWLRREETGAATVWWNVLDPAGRMIGRVSLPAKLRVRYADRTQIWAVELDELDVETLVRFRVVPAGIPPARARH